MEFSMPDRDVTASVLNSVNSANEEDHSQMIHEEQELTTTAITVYVPKKLSYVNVTQKDQFPSKKQGIIMDRVKEFNIEKYIQAVGEIVGAKNVIFALIMSHNRVRIFLSSKQLADEFLETNKTLLISNTSVHVRPIAAWHTKMKRTPLQSKPQMSYCCQSRIT